MFNSSELLEALEGDTLGLPPPEPLPDDDKPVPYFLIGDDAFPLKTWMMKPFATCHLSTEERIFNYRLSRARRIVENAFGILANRFQCILSMLQVDPVVAKTIVMACITLHNLMRIRYPGLQNQVLDCEGEEHQLIPGAWRNQGVLDDVANVTAPTQASREAKRQRVYLKHYYSTVGAVSWQRDMI